MNDIKMLKSKLVEITQTLNDLNLTSPTTIQEAVFSLTAQLFKHQSALIAELTDLGVDLGLPEHRIHRAWDSVAFNRLPLNSEAYVRLIQANLENCPECWAEEKARKARPSSRDPWNPV